MNVGEKRGSAVTPAPVPAASPQPVFDLEAADSPERPLAVGHQDHVERQRGLGYAR